MFSLYFLYIQFMLQKNCVNVIKFKPFPCYYFWQLKRIRMFVMKINGNDNVNVCDTFALLAEDFLVANLWSDLLSLQLFHMLKFLAGKFYQHVGLQIEAPHLLLSKSQVLGVWLKSKWLLLSLFLHILQLPLEQSRQFLENNDIKINFVPIGLIKSSLWFTACFLIMNFQFYILQLLPIFNQHLAPKQMTAQYYSEVEWFTLH